MPIVATLNSLPIYVYLIILIIGIAIVWTIFKKVMKLAITIGIIIFVLVSTGLISKVPPMQEKIDTYVQKIQTMKK